MGTPRFGVLANIADPATPKAVRTVCQAADQLGYDSLAFGDHLRWPILEAWTVLAWAGGITDRIELTHLVLNSTYRHPTILAQMGATLDFLSDGRFTLGIGAGSTSQAEYGPFGFDNPSFAERIGRLEESLELIERLWQNGRCDFDGDYFQLQGASITPRPVQQPRPPILLGGQSDALVNLAVEYDGWNFGFDLSPDACRRRLADFADRCAEAGVDTHNRRTSIGVLLIVADSQTRVEELVTEMATQQDLSVDDFRERYADAFVGTPSEIRSNVEAYLESGIEEFYLWGPSVSDPDALELFARDVMSAVR